MIPITSRFRLVTLMAASLLLGACSGVKTPGTGGGGGGGTTPHSISGTVSGLTGTGLVLQDNGGDSLTITANGPFTFATKVTGAYAVTVLTQPTNPPQICTMANASGTASADVTNVNVTCVASFTVGGTVTGVVGTGLVLQDNAGDNLTITANGSFTFATPVATGSSYSVTILTQPSNPAQTCTVTSGTASGTATGNVSTVAVTCTAVTFSVGGNVVGLLGPPPPPPNSPLTDNSFQLLNNGGDNEIITQNGPFTFATPVAQNGAYFVNAISFPSTQSNGCTLWNYSGVASANVTSILVDCGHDDWTFIGGTKVAGVNSAPNYGSFPATAPPISPNPYTNTPGGRDAGATWVDNSGNLWLFGGLGYELSGKTPPDTLSGFLNDLWECRVGLSDQCEWQLAEAPVAGNFPVAQNEDLPGLYGTKGVASVANLPGGRWGSATWKDLSGNFWLFGGQGESASSAGLLNDLWRYNPGSGQWTWVSGSNANNQAGVYTGAAATLTPGARWSPAFWTDNSGNFWLFGGFGYDKNGQIGVLNDLWKFTGGNWVFVSATVSASETINQNGVYGTQGTPAAGNTPGGRQTAVTWKDAAGNLWLFGGEGEDATGTANGVMNDLWEYDTASNQWTWVDGSNAANVDGVYGLNPSIGPANISTAAGTVGINPGTASTMPGSRWGSSAWTDQAGNLWLFGGWGLDATGTHGNGYLDDLWAYTLNPTNPLQPGTWTWVKGSNTGNENGRYGAGTRPYFTLVTWTPGARRGAMSWIDTQGEFWLFGGQGYDSTSGTGDGYLNDLWRYVPYP
ncbi:MAG: kelch motif-containing protein [Acidobacteriota bacterium]|nr:kelch motif-containing protein [Acidobacteriota bacterium]